LLARLAVNGVGQRTTLRPRHAFQPSSGAHRIGSAKWFSVYKRRRFL
jgi:hypothetical protein